jgi:hypothetical protein
MPRQSPYGVRHKEIRARMLRQLPLDCFYCHKPITRAGDFELDHAPGEKEKRLPGSRPAHLWCNRAHGATIPGGQPRRRPVADAAPVQSCRSYHVGERPTIQSPGRSGGHCRACGGFITGRVW